MKQCLWVTAILAGVACDNEAPAAKESSEPRPVAEKPAPAPETPAPSPEPAEPAQDGKKETEEKEQDGKEKEEHVDKRGVSRGPDAYAKYVGFMEKIGAQKRGIRKDIDAKAGEEAIKKRLEAIRKLAQGAREVRYLKKEEGERSNEELDTYFQIFIDIKVNQFIGDTWNDATSDDLYGRLGSACNTCHDWFNPEE